MFSWEDGIGILTYGKTYRVHIILVHWKCHWMFEVTFKWMVPKMHSFETWIWRQNEIQQGSQTLEPKRRTLVQIFANWAASSQGIREHKPNKQRLFGWRQEADEKSKKICPRVRSTFYSPTSTCFPGGAEIRLRMNGEHPKPYRIQTFLRSSTTLSTGGWLC